MNQPIKHKWALAGLAARCLGVARQIVGESASIAVLAKTAVDIAHEILRQCNGVEAKP